MEQLVYARHSVREVLGSIPRCDLKAFFRLLSFRCGFKDFQNLYLGALMKRERKTGEGTINALSASGFSVS